MIILAWIAAYFLTGGFLSGLIEDGEDLFLWVFLWPIGLFAFLGVGFAKSSSKLILFPVKSALSAGRKCRKLFE